MVHSKTTANKKNYSKRTRQPPPPTPSVKHNDVTAVSPAALASSNLKAIVNATAPRRIVAVSMAVTNKRRGLTTECASDIRGRFTFPKAGSTTRVMSIETTNKVIDSHLHVWASSDEAATKFPYVQNNLKASASTASLLEQMKQNGVGGAVIVQPINHKFDHSYVTQAIKKHPNRFKGKVFTFSPLKVS